MSFPQPLTPKPSNASFEQQSFGIKFKEGCSNLGNRIYQQYQHSTLVVALKTLLGKETSISRNGYHRCFGKYGETTLRKFWHAIKQDLKLTLVNEMRSITWKQDNFSIESCTPDELKKLVTFTKLRIAKGKNDFCKDVSDVQTDISTFIKNLDQKIHSDSYTFKHLQTDLQKLAIIKKICQQEAKECIRTLKCNQALMKLDSELQERTKSLFNDNGFVDLTACPIGELKKLVVLARLREKKGKNKKPHAVEELRKCFSNFIQSLSHRMPPFMEEDERSRLVVIQKLCPDEVKEFMERVQEFEKIEDAKTLKKLKGKENRLW